MNKNIVIAVLTGMVVGQFSSNYAHADSSPGISKHDLIEACALGGIFANSSYIPPLGIKPTSLMGRRTCEAVKQYADALCEKQ